MILSWFRQWRRNKLLATPFPAEWQEYLERNVVHYRWLSADEQARLRDELRFFIAEKHWEGCAGLTVTDEMKVTIAAQACLMALGLASDPFRQISSILIYPTVYSVPVERWHESWSIKDEDARLGESWYRGPVILSWRAVRREARHPGQGRNLVWHEFAHQIDMLDRSTNGTPPLETLAARQKWHDVMTAEFEQLVRDAKEGRATLLDTYGASNEAEFFAVASECFFDCPVELRAEHPHLYELLQGFYNQDPAQRVQVID